MIYSIYHNRNFNEINNNKNCVKPNGIMKFTGGYNNIKVQENNS